MAGPADTFGRVVRFVCGLLLGLLFGVPLWLQVGHAWSGLAQGAAVAATAIAFGLASATRGDAFWRWFLRAD